MLLPGNMCDERMWSAVAHGHLPNAAMLAPKGDTIKAMAMDALACVDGPLVPIGFSMGGIVALAMANLKPERIVGIGLVDTNPGADLPERAQVRPRQQRDVRSNGVERVVTEELKPNYLARANRGDATLLTLIRDMAVDLGPDVFIAQSEALRTRADQWPVVDRLGVPVFVACGAEDSLCPPDLHRRIAARAPASELHIIAGAGHLLPLEKPRILGDLLAAWLLRVTESRSCPLPS